MSLTPLFVKKIPHGNAVQRNERQFARFENMHCWAHLLEHSQNRTKLSLGTLGSGNHFIEAYANGYIAVHTGSRNIGLAVAQYYQKLAEQNIDTFNNIELHRMLPSIPEKARENWLKKSRIDVPRELCFLVGKDMANYLSDMCILQQFADANRSIILETIIHDMGGKIIDSIDSVHNHIDTDTMILRKGAISAQKDEKLVIPLNMRDGLLICVGKGNPE